MLLPVDFFDYISVSAFQFPLYSSFFSQAKKLVVSNKRYQVADSLILQVSHLHLSVSAYSSFFFFFWSMSVSAYSLWLNSSDQILIWYPCTDGQWYFVDDPAKLARRVFSFSFSHPLTSLHVYSNFHVKNCDDLRKRLPNSVVQMVVHCFHIPFLFCLFYVSLLA